MSTSIGERGKPYINSKPALISLTVRRANAGIVLTNNSGIVRKKLPKS
jgi:hypothetical protein